jgi:stage II sporulation protein P
MIYKNRSDRNYANFSIMAINYVFMILLIFFVGNNFKIYMKNYNPSNLFYIQLINYSMPTIGVTSFEEETLSESDGNLGKQIIKIIGLDIYSPAKILGREITFVKGLNFEKVGTNENETVVHNINPFNINDSQIKRVEPEKISSNPNASTNVEGTAVNVYNPTLKKAINRSKPEIFIYHTHTTEAYDVNEEYTQDLTKTVASVGDVLASELENNYGISVVHDKTIHDISRTGAYGRSIVTLDKYLKQYGEFKMIIDLHRDSVPNKSTTTEVFNNESIAKIMFVLAKKSPFYSKNEAVVRRLEEISNKLFPGFSRSTFYKAEANGTYNQDRQANTVLIEVGAEKNTLGEGQNSAKYIARIIAEYLNGK